MVEIERQHRRLIYAFESKDIYFYWVVNVKTWILKLEETPNFIFVLLSFVSLMFLFVDKPMLLMNVVLLWRRLNCCKRFCQWFMFENKTTYIMTQNHNLLFFLSSNNILNFIMFRIVDGLYVISRFEFPKHSM